MFWIIANARFEFGGGRAGRNHVMRTPQTSRKHSRSARIAKPLPAQKPQPGFHYFPSPETSDDNEIIAMQYLYCATAVDEWPGYRRWLEETGAKLAEECDQIETHAIDVFREVRDAIMTAIDTGRPDLMSEPRLLDRMTHAHAFIALHADPESLTAYRLMIYPQMEEHPEFVRPEHRDFVEALRGGKWVNSGDKMPSEITRGETRSASNRQNRGTRLRSKRGVGRDATDGPTAPPEQTFVLKVNPDQPDKSVSGRVCFIQAVSVCCPGFWENLRDDVLLVSGEFFRLRATGQDVPPETHNAAQASLDRWLWDWNIEDEWLMDSCRHTLDAWAAKLHHDGSASLENIYPLPVWYSPNEPILAAALSSFSPTFDSPYPLPKRALSPEDRRILVEGPPTSLRIYEGAVERESPAEFKKRMRGQFEAQLADYTAARESRILLQRGNQRRDAEWTALFHFGMTPKQLVTWEINRSSEVFSQARIQQVIKAFAAAIGLTLRPPKAGRAAKGRKPNPAGC
jgi:hypothetical protein